MAKIQPDLLSDGEDFPVVFGRYTLLGVLGEGGMARVFRAELQGMEGFRKKAAIKIIRASVAASNENLGKALINEARLGGLLHHPNVVETYEYGEVDDLPFIAMEHVRGVGLDEVLEEGLELTSCQLLEIAAQICAGLDHAHNLEDAGVDTELVHRDLKPSNILLSRDGLVKVMDFGIAKAAALSTSMTQTGMTKGTPAYMSPEQVAGDPLDRRSDLFAFGAILYELALGTRMFGGDSLMTVLAAVLQVEERLERSDSRARLNAVVPGLADIVFRCMRKDPGGRYNEAGEVEDALKVLLRKQEPGESLRSFVRAAMRGRPGGASSLDTSPSGEEVAPTLATPDAVLAEAGSLGASSVAVGPTVQQEGYVSRTAPSGVSGSVSITSGEALAGPGAEAGSGSSVPVPPGHGVQSHAPAQAGVSTSEANLGGAAAPGMEIPATRLVSQPATAMPPALTTPVAGTPSTPDGTLWATPQTRRSALQVLVVGLGVGLLLAVVVGIGAVMIWNSLRSNDGALKTGQDEVVDLGSFDSFPVAEGRGGVASREQPQREKSRPGRSTSPGSSVNAPATTPLPSATSEAQEAEEVEPEPEPLPVAEPEEVRADDEVVPPDATSKTEELQAEAESQVTETPPPEPRPEPQQAADPAPAPPEIREASGETAAAMERNKVRADEPASQHLHMGDIQGEVVERTSRGTRLRFKGRIHGATKARVVFYYNPPKARWLKQRMQCSSDGWCSTVVSLEGVSKGRIVYYVSVNGVLPDGREKRWRSEEAKFSISR